MALTPNNNPKRRKQKNDQELLKSQYAVKMIPKQVLKPSGIFLLKGNLFFDLNPDTQSRVSSMNYFKQISSSTIHRDIGILYRTVQTQVTQFDSCEKVAYLMKRSDQIELNQFADLLKGHDTTQRAIDEINQRMKVIAQSNQQIKMIIDQKRKEFDVLRSEKIMQMSKNKRFFMFFDSMFDYEGMQLKMVGNGLSEAWIKLMGCDINTMQGMSMRKGIISFFEGNTKWNLFKFMLEQMNNENNEENNFGEQQQPANMDICFRTLDDILIHTTFATHSLFCNSGSAFEGYFHPEYSKYIVDRKTIFFEIHISDFHINTINGIRSQNREKYSNSSPQYPEESHSQQQQKHNNSALDCILPSQNNNNNSDASCNDCQGMEIESNLIYPKTAEHSQVNVIAPSSNSLVENMLDDIPYVVQSEDFVQKFYGMKVIEDLKTNQLPTKECGFKCI